MENSRTRNTCRIILAGLVQRFAAIIFPFINRTILIYVLGVEFAGLSSLFLSILSMLSLAELGFNSAIVYSMYSPIAENDVQKVSELLTLYRKIYKIVGAVILTSGVILMPFLPKLIGGEVPEGINLYVVYLLYLANTVAGYFLFSYRESILLASQRQDVCFVIRTIVVSCQYLVQAVILLVWRNFYIYLGTAILFTILTNIVIATESKKKFPQYSCLKGCRVKLPESIKKQVSSLLIAKVCDRTRNSLDSMILSAYLGLALVAIYDNYYFIYSAIYEIVLMVCSSMAASVGNSIACESVQKNYRDLQKFSFMAAWFFGWCGICLLCLYQPFMELWVGRDLMLGNLEMVLFCIYFYSININNVRNQYINGTGLWEKLRLTYIAEAGGNIILNLVLGKYFGIAGIIIATIITIVSCNFIWRSKILFNNYFKGMSLRNFFGNNIYWALSVFTAAAVTYVICIHIPGSAFSHLFSNLAICIVVPNLLLMLFYWKTEQFRAMKQFIIRNFNRT